LKSDEKKAMPPRKREKGTEPTRRSARTVSQASSAPAPESKTPKAPKAPKAPKKRAKEDEPKEESKEESKEGEPATVPELTTEETSEKPPEAKKAKTGLAIGDKLPDIDLVDEDGNPVKVREIASEKGIILFAYPKASTPGCTKQVRSSRDNWTHD
jgi:thioredoxin-dependent peroxiredoxin